jgi:hypothetical protein
MAKVKSKSFKKNTKKRVSKKYIKKSKSRRRFRKFRGGISPTGEAYAARVMGNALSTVPTPNIAAGELLVARQVANQFVPETNVNNIGTYGENYSYESPSASSGSSSSSRPTSYYTNPAGRPVVGIIENKNTTNFAPLPGTYNIVVPNAREKKIQELLDTKQITRDERKFLSNYDIAYKTAYDKAMETGENPKEAATKYIVKYMKTNGKSAEDIAFVLYLDKNEESVDKVTNLLMSMEQNA